MLNALMLDPATTHAADRILDSIFPFMNYDGKIKDFNAMPGEMAFKRHFAELDGEILYWSTETSNRSKEAAELLKEVRAALEVAADVYGLIGKKLDIGPHDVAKELVNVANLVHKLPRKGLRLGF